MHAKPVIRNSMPESAGVRQGGTTRTPRTHLIVLTNGLWGKGMLGNSLSYAV